VPEGLNHRESLPCQRTLKHRDRRTEKRVWFD